MPFIQWLSDWGIALVAVPTAMLSVLYARVCFRRKLYDQGYMGLVFAELFLGGFTIFEPPLDELIPFEWQVIFVLIILVVFSITMLFYVRTMRALKRNQHE